MLLVTGMAQAGTPVAKAYSTEKPNILLIISDDQGYGDFGFMGNKVLRTPQLDKLAASAAIFENYTTGVACSPGRAMLFSGRWMRSVSNALRRSLFPTQTTGKSRSISCC